jgi:predicted Rossmann-fold nucleotide-binding protein
MQMVQHAVDEGFSTDSAIRLINISDTPEQLISSMDTYTSPSEDQKWNTER